MKDLDIDHYIATFERLAAAAEWEPDAKGTIAQFKAGLEELIHKRILYRETWPTTMIEWKTAAQREVERVRELRNANFAPKKRNQFQSTTTQSHHSQTNNNGVVPMDVDSTTTSSTPKLKKLTKEEHDKLAQEGHCFHHRRQGHMARECPQNQNNTNVHTTSTSSTSSSTSTATPSSTAPKKTKAQQIAALIASMTEEERGDYLESQDQDFSDAEL
jgi:hypothetical protein